MADTYHLFMLAFTFFSASIVFSAGEMGYPILSTVSGILFVATVFMVETYNERITQKDTDIN